MRPVLHIKAPQSSSPPQNIEGSEHEDSAASRSPPLRPGKPLSRSVPPFLCKASEPSEAFLMLNLCLFFSAGRSVDAEQRMLCEYQSGARSQRQGDPHRDELEGMPSHSHHVSVHTPQLCSIYILEMCKILDKSNITK